MPMPPELKRTTPLLIGKTVLQIHILVDGFPDYPKWPQTEAENQA